MSEQWKPQPWLAVIFGIISHEFAFLYVNRSGLFWFYLLVKIPFIVIDFFYGLYSVLIFSIICPIHTFQISKLYDPDQRRRWYARWWSIPCLLSVAFLSVFLFRSFLYEPFKMPSSSMSPNIGPGDMIVTKKWGFGNYGTYGLSIMRSGISDHSKIQIGKIYVIKHPKNDKLILKRLIAFPGDHIRVDKQDVIINGERLLSSPTSESHDLVVSLESNRGSSYAIQHRKRLINNRSYDFQIPDNHYFFLGDNRDNSEDSRIFGAINKNYIVAEVIAVF